MLAQAPYSSASQAPLAATLPSKTATTLKRQGWPGIMADVRREGHLLITNHNLPEAVILPPEEYDRLVVAAKNAALAPAPKIEALKMKFRERMKALQSEDAEHKLSTLMSQPLRLNGSVIAGETC